MKNIKHTITTEVNKFNLTVHEKFTLIKALLKAIEKKEEGDPVERITISLKKSVREMGGELAVRYGTDFSKLISSLIQKENKLQK